MKKIQSETIMHADFYKGATSTSSILKIFKRVEESLLENKGDLKKQESTVSEFKEICKKLEVIISNKNKTSEWMQTPLVMQANKYKMSLYERFSFLMREKILLTGTATETNSGIVSNLKYPIKFKTKKRNYKVSKSEEINKLYLIILYLTSKIESILELTELENVGIFPSPQAVISINSLESWIKKTEKNSNLIVGNFVDYLEVIEFRKFFETAEILDEVSENEEFELFEVGKGES